MSLTWSKHSEAMFLGSFWVRVIDPFSGRYLVSPTRRCNGGVGLASCGLAKMNLERMDSKIHNCVVLFFCSITFDFIYNSWLFEILSPQSGTTRLTFPSPSPRPSVVVARASLWLAIFCVCVCVLCFWFWFWFSQTLALATVANLGGNDLCEALLPVGFGVSLFFCRLFVDAVHFFFIVFCSFFLFLINSRANSESSSSYYCI